jgi:hypothetical protein
MEKKFSEVLPLMMSPGSFLPLFLSLMDLPSKTQHLHEFIYKVHKVWQIISLLKFVSAHEEHIPCNKRDLRNIYNMLS